MENRQKSAKIEPLDLLVEFLWACSDRPFAVKKKSGRRLVAYALSEKIWTKTDHLNRPKEILPIWYSPFPSQILPNELGVGSFRTKKTRIWPYEAPALWGGGSFFVCRSTILNPRGPHTSM